LINDFQHRTIHYLPPKINTRLIIIAGFLLQINQFVPFRRKICESQLVRVTVPAVPGAARPLSQIFTTRTTTNFFSVSPPLRIPFDESDEEKTQSTRY
jgi:hypothetical protein